MTPIQEQEMWRALRRGDPRGLEELMSRYTPYVAAVAARVLPGRPQDWEELTADVFLSAWEHRKALRPEQIRGWLGKVARNRALNRLRASREVLALEEDVLCLAEDGPQRLLEEREQAELVRRAKTRLRRGREKLKEHLRKAGFCVEEAEDLKPDERVSGSGE